MKMVPPIFPLILAVLVGLGLLGCKQKLNTVNGQIFIVTQGAENVRLGDVNIFLIEKQDTLDFLRQKESALTNGIAVWNAKMENARSEATAADVSYKEFFASKPYTTNGDYVRFDAQLARSLKDGEALQKSHETIWKENEQCRAATRTALVKRTPEFVYLDFKANSIVDLKWRSLNIPEVEPPTYEPAVVAAWRSYLKSAAPKMKLLATKIEANEHETSVLKARLGDIAEKAEEEEKNKSTDAQTRLNNVERGKAVFLTSIRNELLENFPKKYAQEVHSDADGRFSISYPQGKSFVFFARAERNVINKMETYSWLVNVPDDVKSPYVLSNSKLTDNDPDGFLRFSRLY